MLYRHPSRSFCVLGKKLEENNQKSYLQSNLPEVVGFPRPSFARTGVVQFLQDNAPVHTAAVVKEYLDEHGIPSMIWPPYSPDLNPMENVLRLMKSYIQDRYGDSVLGRQRGRAEIQSLMKEALQECTKPETLANIFSDMQDWCLAVIRAQGGSIDH